MAESRYLISFLNAINDPRHSKRRIEVMSGVQAAAMACLVANKKLENTFKAGVARDPQNKVAQEVEAEASHKARCNQNSTFLIKRKH